MSTKRKARLIVFVAVAATLGGGLFLYVTPASTNVTSPSVDVRLGSTNNVTTYRSWGPDLSADAVDAAGIETDLDGNASALYPSDWCGRPACGNLGQP
jgi:hypothetical protein